MSEYPSCILTPEEEALRRECTLFAARQEGYANYVSRLLKLAVEAEHERRIKGEMPDERTDVEIYLNAVRIVVGDQMLKQETYERRQTI